MENRNCKLDLLRALSIVLVLVWHFQPIKIAVTKHATALGKGVFYLIDFFYYEVSLVAVPTFFLVSLYLFFQGADIAAQGATEPYRFTYLIRRLWRILSLLLFWVAVQNAVGYAVHGKLGPLSLETLLIGGPSLPTIGPSVFYFLSNLLILTAVAYLFGNLNGRQQKICGWAALAVFLVRFETQLWFGNQTRYYDVENFILLVPVAHTLYRHGEQLARYRYFILIGYMLFALHDTIFHHALGLRLASYSRVSVFLGATALCVFVLRSRLSQRRIIQWVSQHSLGLFAVHKFWFYLVFVKLTYPLPRLPFQGVALGLRHFTVALLGIALTIVCVAVLAKTPFRRFVR